MNIRGQTGGAVTASLSPCIARHYGWNVSFPLAASLCALRFGDVAAGGSWTRASTPVAFTTSRISDFLNSYFWSRKN